MSVSERWIVIPRWDEFQHYKDRDPPWIKNHRGLLSSEEYLDLTFVQRGILHGLWIAYSTSNRQIPDSTSAVSRRLGQRVTRASLDALYHAGFLTYSASKPLASCKQPVPPEAEAETQTQEETEVLTTNGYFSEGREELTSYGSTKNANLDNWTQPAESLEEWRTP